MKRTIEREARRLARWEECIDVGTEPHRSRSFPCDRSYLSFTGTVRVLSLLFQYLRALRQVVARAPWVAARLFRRCGGASRRAPRRPTARAPRCGLGACDPARPWLPAPGRMAHHMRTAARPPAPHAPASDAARADIVRRTIHPVHPFSITAGRRLRATSEPVFRGPSANKSEPTSWET